MKKALPLVHNHLTEESRSCHKHRVTATLTPSISCPSPGGESQPRSLAGTHVFAQDAPSLVSARHRCRIRPPGEATDHKAAGTARQGLTQQSLEEFTLEDVRDFSDGGF